MSNRDFSWAGTMGALNLFAFAWSASGATEVLASEQGLLELGQLGFIFLAASVLMLTFVRSRGPGRSAALMLATLAVGLFYRELDLAALGVSEPLAVLTKGSVRDVVLGVMGVGLGVYAWRQREDWPDWFRLIRRPDAWPLLAAGCAIAGGVVTDFLLEDNLRGQFWEELLEFNGYALFLLAAARHGRLTSRDEVVTRPVMPS